MSPDTPGKVPSARGHSRSRRAGDGTHHAASEERWLLTYADMITLLLVLFIVLYAISAVDKAKFKEFKQSISKAVLTATPHGTVAKAPPAKSDTQTPSHLKAIEAELSKALKENGLLKDVSLHIGSSGLVEGLVADSTFFVTNSAALSPIGVEIVDTSAQVLRHYHNAIEVAGYTDNAPIVGGIYANNWALSAARATTVVVRMTTVDKVNPGQVVILGDGQYHPIVPNTTPQNQAENRRVNIVVSPSGSFVQ